MLLSVLCFAVRHLLRLLTAGDGNYAAREIGILVLHHQSVACAFKGSSPAACRLPRNFPGFASDNAPPVLIPQSVFGPSFGKFWTLSRPPTQSVASALHMHVEAAVDEPVEHALRH
jgi:hypothetical protein